LIAKARRALHNEETARKRSPLSDHPERSGALAHEEIARYSRHLTLPEVGVEGQLRLRGASALLVGAGGLGSPLGIYLATAGLGRLGLVDFDVVDLSNLQRQVLYGTPDIGRPKLDLARRRIEEINPHVTVDTHPVRLTSDNALEILRDYDLVIDGTDNFPTRYLVNDACVLLGKPNVYGSIFRFEGQVSVFWAKRGPCYRCLYPDPPPPGAVPNCAEGGVLGVLPGIIGSMQATEAIKLILERGEPLIGRLMLLDALEMRFRELRLRKDPQCPVCGESPSIRELIDYEAACGVATASPSLESTEMIDVDSLRGRLDCGEPPTLLDVRTQQEWAICRLQGATLIPLRELGARVEELDRGQEIIVYCHLGVRGARAVELLRGYGFSKVRNLSGGIDAWSISVDPSIPRY
jgi:adenylyltransferase/sulfurtransferase